MKRSFKIILISSLVLNLIFIVLQISTRPAITSTRPTPIDKNLNVEKTKNNFLDQLFKKYPAAKEKKYFFINFWDTGHMYLKDQLPMLDTLVEPLRNDFAYVFNSPETDSYAEATLKAGKIKTKNFLYVNNSNLIDAIHLEKKIELSFWNNRKSPINIILDKQGKVLYFDTLDAYSGPKWPKDSIADRRLVTQLNKALSDVK